MAPTSPADKERFRNALNRMIEDVRPQILDVAASLKVTPNYLSQMRNPENPRGPQPGWEAIVAEACRRGAERYRRKAADLEALADELEGER